MFLICFLIFGGVEIGVLFVSMFMINFWVCMVMVFKIFCWLYLVM